MNHALLPMLGPQALGERLPDLVTSPGFVPLALLTAFGAGALHAVGPGHGKSLAAAYLVGSDGRRRDAAWMAGSVAVMHTLSVLIVAVAWTFLSLSDLVRLDQLTAGLRLVAGLLVVATGGWLLRRHLRARDGEHGHRHGHGHGHGHGTQVLEAEAPVEAAPGRRPGIVLLGISGGLTPSPAAFLVLVTGLYVGRAGFALALVVAFGAGLAAVLYSVGLLAIAGSAWLTRAAGSRRLLGLATRAAPALAAVSITLLGGAITALAVLTLLG